VAASAEATTNVAVMRATGVFTTATTTPTPAIALSESFAIAGHFARDFLERMAGAGAFEKHCIPVDLDIYYE
jgi:hypothetical protein